MNLGLCANHCDTMEPGGLIPKGPKCFNRAEFIVIYDEILGNTQEVTKLCSSCLANMRKNVRAKKRERVARSRFGTTSWAFKVTVIPPDKVKKEHIQALVKRYIRVPRETMLALGVEEW